MKKYIAIAAVIILLGVVAAFTPIHWFRLAPGMDRAKVYALCGEPTSTSSEGVKGVFWKKTYGSVPWTLLVAFEEDRVYYHDIYFDIKKPIDVRVHVVSHNKFRPRI